ncbi:hypothetical protein FQN54_002791 [Arachnomyces sp. PD_36]|nr:hypothetical protein FQN54_002791 [Arachnomyces sp. PD_36]
MHSFGNIRIGAKLKSPIQCYGTITTSFNNLQNFMLYPMSSIFMRYNCPSGDVNMKSQNISQGSYDLDKVVGAANDSDEWMDDFKTRRGKNGDKDKKYTSDDGECDGPPEEIVPHFDDNEDKDTNNVEGLNHYDGFGGGDWSDDSGE